MIEVPAYGPCPSDFLIVGEAPGAEEARRMRPFCGKSGDVQAKHFSDRGISISKCRLTNVVRRYIDGNPDPSPDLLCYYTRDLQQEIARTNPRLIVAVGRFAARWFMGDETELEVCHGRAYSGLKRAQDAIVIPIYHVAAGFYNVDRLPDISRDYDSVIRAIKLIQSDKIETIHLSNDSYAGNETYIDVGGEELATYLKYDNPEFVGLDTEDDYSIQISTHAGSAYVLRIDQPDFSHGISAIQSLANSGVEFITHQADTPAGTMYDTVGCRAWGLELRRAKIWDTMYAAYLLCLESRSLKALARRWLGMKMEDYEDIIEGLSRGMQIEYLRNALTLDWPPPHQELVEMAAGVLKLYKPNSISTAIKKILGDIDSGKVDKDGILTDPKKRWNNLPNQNRTTVEAKLGSLPFATLRHADQNLAIFYAGRDADATRRLKAPLKAQLDFYDINLDDQGSKVLPILEELQGSGMPASRKKFDNLVKIIERDKARILNQLVNEFNGGRLMNPNSPPDVNKLLGRRGLRGEKRTPTGDWSTGKKSIEGLRYKDGAVALVFDYREADKILTTYCRKPIEISNRIKSTMSISAQRDHFTVHTHVHPCKQVSRRLSTTDPSLLNQPARSNLGVQLRDCYEVEERSDYCLVGVDFSGQEARVAAHYAEWLTGTVSHLASLIRTCAHCGTRFEGATCPSPKSKNGKHKSRDIHTETASRVFGIPLDQVDANKHRMPSKTAFFGILNGMAGNGLLDQFRMDILPEYDPDEHWLKLENCQNLVNEIMNVVYPELGMASNLTRQIVRNNPGHFIRDLFGMYRYLPRIVSDDMGEQSEASRQAFNLVIQGTAQGMTQSAMIWLDPIVYSLQQCGIEVWWLLQVHDELIFMTRQEYAQIVADFVIDAMVNHHGIKLRVPIEAEAHIARSWGKLKS